MHEPVMGKAAEALSLEDDAKGAAGGGGDNDDNKGSDCVDERTSIIDVLPEMKENTELSELRVTGVGDVDLGQSDGALNSDFATLGGKKNKKNKVYVAPVEDEEFHDG
jgi:hypothetical protein